MLENIPPNAPPIVVLLFDILGAIAIILGLLILAFLAYDYWRSRK